MTLDIKPRNRRSERFEATRSEILEASWALVRESGLSGWALKDVALKVGMRAPSLYWYFDSKHAIYDEMFAQGNRSLLDQMNAVELAAEPESLLTQLATLFMEFAVQDAARFQLMFQRTIPDFQPSAESYALASTVLARAREWFEASGNSDSSHFDLWTALISGLASQQLANDPNGDRWRRLIDDAVAMFVNHVLSTEH
jgi:AcrR family transcriptional regulator